jgi:hypothetical protein
MTSAQRHKRVRWRVRRVPEGWLAIVLIGEEPSILDCLGCKADAKRLARNKASSMKAAYGGA